MTFTSYLNAWNYMRNHGLKGSIKCVGWSRFVIQAP